MRRVRSATLLGIEAVPVDVEAQIISSLKRFTIVGLPDGVLRESRDRIRCAIENSGFSFPSGEIIVSLGPASLPKHGPAFDLPIALSILAADGQIDESRLGSVLAIGELALDGRLKPVNGALSAASCAEKCRKDLLVPKQNAREAALVSNVRVFAVGSLVETLSYLNFQHELSPVRNRAKANGSFLSRAPNFADVIGQHAAKRALEIVAAGGHHLLMVGPPGSGKSMLAQRLASILPPLVESEIIEVTKVYSAFGTESQKAFGEGLRSQRVISQRPFRAPHYTMSTAGLVGGGSYPLPGEISLAHRGVLFLDELPEMRRDAVEALRQPLESRNITISRAKQRMSFPADFILLAAMNPCPCGWHGSGDKRCDCTTNHIWRYRSRISGPILDRFDLQIQVPAVPLSQLHQGLAADPTEEMRQRVLLARGRQLERFRLQDKVNSHMSTSEIKRWCALRSGGLKLLEAAAKKYGFSARAYTRVLRVARSIADLEGIDSIDDNCLAEALSYRNTT